MANQKRAQDDAMFPIRKIMMEEAEESLATPHPIMTLAKLLTTVVGILFLFFGVGIPIAILDYAIFLSYPYLPLAGIIIPSVIFAAIVVLPFALMSLVESAGYRDTFRVSLQKEFVFARVGTIAPAYAMIPYENIQDVQLSEGLFEKLTGTASIVISTPASAMSVPLIEISLARGLKERLLGLAEKHRNMAE